MFTRYKHPVPWTWDWRLPVLSRKNVSCRFTWKNVRTSHGRRSNREDMWLIFKPAGGDQINDVLYCALTVVHPSVFQTDKLNQESSECSQGNIQRCKAHNIYRLLPLHADEPVSMMKIKSDDISVLFKLILPPPSPVPVEYLSNKKNPPPRFTTQHNTTIGKERKKRSPGTKSKQIVKTEFGSQSQHR